MITAKLKYLRTSPRKVRLVVDLIRGLDVTEAENQLKFLPKRAAEPVLKLLKSAIANALHDFEAVKENLFVTKITVDPGPTLKRWMPRAMGRATPILKRTSHITIGLGLKDGKVLAKKKVDKKLEKEDKSDIGLKKVDPEKPYKKTSKPKEKFFSRQTLGNAKKIFRRKSI